MSAPKNLSEWNVRDPQDHAVYIMGHLSADYSIVGLTKVGISKHPRERLRQVQSVEPARIVLVGQFWFWKRDHALRVEKAFHRVCDGWRVRGEWFDMDPFHAVGVMNANLRSFADDFLGADDVSDTYDAYYHLNVPGFDTLNETLTFGHEQ